MSTRHSLPVHHSNLYVRRSLGGEYQVVCRWLIRDLLARDLWHSDMRKQLMENHGTFTR